MVIQIIMPGMEMKNLGKAENGTVTESNETGRANFEDAMVKCGNGKFQFKALLSSGLCLYAILCETSCIAFVLPAAQCDLDMSMNEKGMLSASVFIGFISSAHMWGAVGDVWGRRRTMIFALLADVISTIASAFAPSFVPLLICRFFSGLFSCAPSGLLYVYAGEFFANAQRPRAIIGVGALGAISMISLPTIALFVIPSSWSLQIPYFTSLPILNSWRLFLAMCTLPSIAASLVLIFFMPESPKFLLESGRQDEALQVFRDMYALNSGKSKSEYPIHTLVRERGVESDDKKKSICSTIWDQTAPLFKQNLICKTCLVSFLQFAAFFGFNPLFLWLPEMFNRISDYAPGTVTLCDVMGPETAVNSTLILFEEGLAAAGDSHGLFPINLLEYNVTTNYTCDSSVDDSAFVNSLILNGAASISNIMSVMSINILGKRKLLMFAFIASGSLCATLSYIKDPTLLLVLYCMSAGIACACPGTIQAVTIDLFPTNLRGMASSLAMMSGRVGVICGTMVFGILLEVKCELPFLMLSAALVLGGIISIKVPAR